MTADRVAHRICPLCEATCGLAIEVRGDEVVSIRGNDADVFSAGFVCPKAVALRDLHADPDRLRAPLVKRDGRFVEVGWDEAFAEVERRLPAIQHQHGRDAVAVFGGGGLTNEKAYALGKFARTVLRTANIDYNGRFCMASAAAGANRAFGADRGLPFPLADLAGADAVVLLGSNLAETMPPSVQHLAGVRSRGGLVVVDPRRSATAALTGEPGSGVGHAGDQGVHVQPVPGTDLVVLLALLHVVVAEGLVDDEYVATRTTGFDDVRRAAASVDGIAEVDVEVGVMTPAERAALTEKLRDGRPARQMPFGPDSLTRVILVSSGKGGVGKSTLTANLAVALAAQGLAVGLVDADVHGFSIPGLLGIPAGTQPTRIDDLMLPPVAHDVKTVSIGMFLRDGEAVVAWRGPMLHRTVQQFLTDVFFGDIDVLLIDMPPGTGDVAISIGQLLPHAEVLVVTTPQ